MHVERVPGAVVGAVQVVVVLLVVLVMVVVPVRGEEPCVAASPCLAHVQTGVLGVLSYRSGEKKIK